MGFTPTQRLADMTDKPVKYPIERAKNGALLLTDEQKALFAKLYTRNSTPKMMELFGISFTTVHRLAKIMGLQKDLKVIRHKQAMQIKRLCEKNGYYDSLRGKPINEVCRAAAKRKRAEGFHPMKSLKENNIKRYNKICKERSEKRLALERKERRRREIGYAMTKLHRPQFKFTKREINVRYRALKFGYILGDYREDSGERYIIFYDANTSRSMRFEKFVDTKTSFRIREKILTN